VLSALSKPRMKPLELSCAQGTGNEALLWYQTPFQGVQTSFTKSKSSAACKITLSVHGRN